MIVKTSIGLTAHDVLVMHKNARDEFRDHIYTFMCYYDCSRTKEEILDISTEELMKDMWYLNMCYGTYMDISEIDSELMHRMLCTLNACGVDTTNMDKLFHTYVETLLDEHTWENV